MSELIAERFPVLSDKPCVDMFVMNYGPAHCSAVNHAISATTSVSDDGVGGVVYSGRSGGLAVFG